jgi:hypothetical protein
LIYARYIFKRADGSGIGSFDKLLRDTPVKLPDDLSLTDRTKRPIISPSAPAPPANGWSQTVSATNSKRRRTRLKRSRSAIGWPSADQPGFVTAHPDDIAEAIRAHAKPLVDALNAAVNIADEAAREWDAAPFGMKAGKLLLALAGHVKGYRADITAIHEAIAKAGGRS